MRYKLAILYSAHLLNAFSGLYQSWENQLTNIYMKTKIGEENFSYTKNTHCISRNF